MTYHELKDLVVSSLQERSKRPRSPSPAESDGSCVDPELEAAKADLEEQLAWINAKIYSKTKPRRESNTSSVPVHPLHPCQSLARTSFAGRVLLTKHPPSILQV